MVHLFRVTGWLEGASFLILLFIAMPLKYIAGHPEAVRYVGMTHGLLFVAYVVFSNMVAEELEWPGKTRLYAVIAAIVPTGTFVFDRKYLQGR